MKAASLTSRIVGAIIILSLGIIFIPLLLETDNIVSGVMKKSPIPDVPNEISTIIFQMNEETGKFEEKGKSSVAQFEEEVATKIRDSAQEIEINPTKTNVLAQDSNKNKNAPGKPSVVTAQKQSATTAQHSWMLQVASFKDKKKALSLRDKLRAKQYATFISDRKQDSGDTLWRVRIGPDLNKSRIQGIQLTLKREMDLEGLVIRRR